MHGNFAENQASIEAQRPSRDRTRRIAVEFKKILIAVDEDPIAAHAAEVGVELARSLNAQVALVHALDPSLTFAPDSGLAGEEIAIRAELDSKRLMADFRSRMPAGVNCLQFMPHGQPGEEIVKAAKEWGADAIVIGSHGRSGISRTLVGSVAEGVMRHAPCPVLVVRAND
jgi:nucleotide-binding universal stress UspA family protein